MVPLGHDLANTSRHGSLTTFLRLKPLVTELLDVSEGNDNLYYIIS